VIPQSVQLIDGSTCAGVVLDDFSIEPGNTILHVPDRFLIRIADPKLVHSLSDSANVTIPREIEILERSYLSESRALLSISFEEDSHITRIESYVFSGSSFESLMLTRSVQFINGSAFDCVTLYSRVIEHGNPYCRVEGSFLIYIQHHKLIGHFFKVTEC
jgi:hypothetical protein